MSGLVLCIGGTAPNGPGLSADEEAVLAAGARFVGVATAHTDQGPDGLRELGARESWRWRYEALEAVSIENPVAVKTGLLPGVEHVQELAGLMGQLRFDAPGVPWVLDPVLGSTLGDVFLGEEGVRALRGLLALGPLVTPNLPEAARLTGVEEQVLVEDPGARLVAAQRLVQGGAAGVILKGGHGGEDPLQELVLMAGEAPLWLERPRRSGGLRGSGCRHASFLAAALGLGKDPGMAAREAGEWVSSQIR